MTDHILMCEMLKGLIGGVPHFISNLANASALIYEQMDDINWAGFYLMQDEKLVLGPFQGKPACIEIEVGKGVCGACVLQRKTIVVKNVHEFEGHIACDSASNSEIVVPIFNGARIVGVLDIDSPLIARFDDSDRQGLEAFVGILENELFGK